MRKVLSIAEAVALVEHLRHGGKEVVLTNGVFDILHPGHVRYLQDARREGDALIVAVNSDRSVRAIKGPARPVNPESERAEILAALACVDAVVVFDEDNPQQIVDRLQPDVLVKGADWAMDEIIGRQTVESRGGRVVRIPLAEGYSTSAIIEKIQGQYVGRVLFVSDSPRRVSKTRPGLRDVLMPTSTSLNLQALLKTAAARTGMDSSASYVRGLSSSAQALFVAARSSHRKSAITVVVVPGDEDVDRFCIDTRFFMAALEGASAAARESAVKPFPSLQIDPYRNIAPHFGVASARADALHAIANGTAKIVVASAASLLTRLSPPDNLEAAAIELRNGMDLDPVALGDLLTDAGFTREDPVDEHGEFCVRGGIVDYFPAGADNPIRVEFVGETIESIRRYDPSTQRSIGTLDQASVVPLTEKAGSATFFDYLPGDRDLSFIIVEEEDAAAQATRLAEQVRASFEEAKAENPRLPAPEELLIPWSEVTERLAGATRLDQLAIGDGSTEVDASITCRHSHGPGHDASRWTSPASRRLNSAAGFRSGSPRSSACASAETPCCSSPAPRGVPSAQPSCWRSTACAAS